MTNLYKIRIFQTTLNINQYIRFKIKNCFTGTDMHETANNSTNKIFFKKAKTNTTYITLNNKSYAA